MYFKYLLTAWLSLTSTTAYSQMSEQQLGDFHMRTYFQPYTQQPEQIQLYTKASEQQAFLGIICTNANPFPLIEVLLFDDEVLSESPRLLKVNYQLSPESGDLFQLQGILQVTDTADEFSNKIRFEMENGVYKNLTQLQQAYQTWLTQLMNSQQVQLQLSHQTLGEKNLSFSLNGLKTLLSPHQDLCR